MNITKRWRRFMAVGCSHGNLADKAALAAVLKFKAAWKPDTTAHLGDAFDLTAFRSGAKGTSDETERPKPDVDSGMDFIERLRPQLWLMGNHEDRVYRLRHHYNAIVSELATNICEDIETTAKAIKCEIVPWSFKQSRKVGNYSLLHGWFFNENCCRDHAEAFGNCVFAHAHRAGIGKGRRSDNPTGICVGTLANIPNMDYAKARRSTLSWSAGIVWGEYTDSSAVMWLHEQPQGQPEWRLPI